MGWRWNSESWGPLEIWDGPSQTEIAGAKRRAVLALLVLHANEVVSKDRLIDELWGSRCTGEESMRSTAT